MNYHYIIFDFDGTLFDSRKGIFSSIKYALDFFGIEHPSAEVLSSFIGPPLLKSFQKHLGLSERDSLNALEKLREYYGKTGIFEAEPYDGVLSLLEDLHHNATKTLAIATAKPTLYTNQILDKYQWHHFFKSVKGSRMHGELYTKQRTISEVLDDLGLSQYDDIVMIGDTIYDIKGAQECAINSIAVNYGYGKTQDLKDARPTYFVNTVEELRELLL